MKYSFTGAKGGVTTVIAANETVARHKAMVERHGPECHLTMPEPESNPKRYTYIGPYRGHGLYLLSVDDEP